MVYRVKAGFVRDRPLTAPDLSMYQSSQRAEERPEMTTKSAYDRINHRINSGRSRCKILNQKLSFAEMILWFLNNIINA